MAQSALDLVLDRSSEVPLGTQLAWKLRQAIVSGRLRPGDRLPGLRELATRADVNVNTVRAVLARLGTQGLIVSEQGRGTFVAEVARQDQLAQLAEQTAAEARRAGIDPRDLAVLLFAGAEPAAGSERSALRDEIERLEQERVELEVELAAIDAPPVTVPPAPRPVRPGAPGARILSTAELEAARDQIASEVGLVRRHLTQARERAAAPGDRPVASPQTMPAGGTLSPRWRA